MLSVSHACACPVKPWRSRRACDPRRPSRGREGAIRWTSRTGRAAARGSWRAAARISEESGRWRRRPGDPTARPPWARLTLLLRERGRATLADLHAVSAVGMPCGEGEVARHLAGPRLARRRCDRHQWSLLECWVVTTRTRTPPGGTGRACG